MASADQEVSKLVVVEGRAACPFWMEHWGEEPDSDWSMLEQEEWEPDAAFDVRLQAALERLSLSDAPVSVLLVASSDAEPAAMACRWQRATGILRLLSEGTGGELAVTRGLGYRGQPQPALEALTRDLVGEEWQGSAVDVGLRLADVAPVSRIRSTLPPARAARGATA